MTREDIFKKMSIELWENEITDHHNYNYDYLEFEKDFLRICEEQFRDINFFIGDIFK